MIITLEGNIGAGKTTLAAALFKEFKCRGKLVVHITEPVEAWTDSHGTNLLELYYTDIARWGFTFQTNALLYMTNSDQRAVDLARDGYVVIKERSSFSVRELFTPQLKKHMTKAEYKILSDLDKMVEDPRLVADDINNITLYLRTSPDICYQRIIKRGRMEETNLNGAIDLCYLQRLHDQHEAAKFIGKTYVVDGNDFDTMEFHTADDQGIESIVSVLNALYVKSEEKKHDPGLIVEEAAQFVVSAILKGEEGKQQ